MIAPFTAGLVTGLLFFKPQLAVAVAAVMVACLGRRALAGLAVTGTIYLVVTLITLPGTLGDFVHRLPPIVQSLQEQPTYNWGRQVTFLSFWRLLIQGHSAGNTLPIAKGLAGVSSAIVALSLVGLGLRVLRCRDRNPTAQGDAHRLRHHVHAAADAVLHGL